MKNASPIANGKKQTGVQPKARHGSSVNIPLSSMERTGSTGMVGTNACRPFTRSMPPLTAMPAHSSGDRQNGRPSEIIATGSCVIG